MSAADQAQPVWQPDESRLARSNLRRFIQLLQMEADPWIGDYASLHDYSLRHPRAFWAAVWEFCRVKGERGRPVAEHLDRMPGARWFPDARLNFAENLLRYRDDRPAILFEGEDGKRRQYSYAELYAEVAAVAAALKTAGIRPGDRVAGYLPNLPETVIAMLASASLGAVWSSCSPDFGVNAVVDRLGQIRPRVLFTASAYHYNGKTFDCLEKVQAITSRIEGIEQIVVVPYAVEAADDGTPLPEGMIRWQDFRDASADTLEFERLPFDHPLYILYSSGTTGAPKCIVHGAGGTLLQHLKELVLHTDLKRDDRIFYFTTCGWMMWNWLVSSLAVGATVVLYDGSPFHPGPQRLFDLADALDITIFGTSARSIAGWQNAGLVPRESHDLSALRTLLSTGSPLLPEQFDYVYQSIKEDICLSSISGGTDIVSCFALGCPILPVWRGELQCPGLGMAVEIRRDDGSLAAVGEAGELACAMPFPSMPVGFWGDEDGSRYRDAYFDKIDGVWTHGDYAKFTDHGGLVIFGRSDATLNPGGVRIGTAEIYRQVEQLEPVLESVCVGQDWAGDTRVILFVKLRPGQNLDDDLRDRIRRAIRSGTSPRHVPARIVQVADIPRTLSGKIVELAVREVIHNRPVKNRDALANPEALVLFEDLPELQTD